MERRQVLQVLTAGGLVLLPSVLPGCASQLAAQAGWSGPAAGERDLRRIVLSYGLLAPNPHNKQAWIVRMVEPLGFLLYVDPKRLLPRTDPPFRQIHIGQGTFLEHVVLAAAHHRHRADVTYFPEGEYESTVLEAKPVARVILVPDAHVARDPLFDWIVERQSNKRRYDGTPLAKGEVDGALRSYSRSEFRLALETEPARVRKLAELVTRAMAVETSSRARDEETIAMFRFDDQEMSRYRDGFGLPQVGITGFERFWAEAFLVSRKAAMAPDSDFGKQTVELTKEQAESAAAWGVITSETNTRLDQVRVGRAYARVHLTSTSLGVAQHPMSQILQEYADMAPLQRELLDFLRVPKGHTVQMLFRLGHAEPVVHAPRRTVDDLLHARLGSARIVTGA